MLYSRHDEVADHGWPRIVGNTPERGHTHLDMVTVNEAGKRIVYGAVTKREFGNVPRYFLNMVGTVDEVRT